MSPADAPGSQTLPPLLGERIEIPVEITNPFKNIKIDPKALQCGVIAGSRAAVGGGGRACDQEARGPMIKINLLPSKKKPAKKITELQKQLILGCLILVLVLAGMWFYYGSLSNRIESLTRTSRSQRPRSASRTTC